MYPHTSQSARDRLFAAAPHRTRSSWSLRSLALGAALMYFFDPARGRRRRALLRDRWTHLVRRASDASRVASRDLQQRARGVWAESQRRFRHEYVSDAALVERVRSEMGRYVSHPHALEVQVSEGRVTLSGPILAHEVDDLLRTLTRVPGVQSIDNRLVVHHEAGNISALQGGRPRRHRFEFLQDNWSPAARLLGGVGGGVLVAIGRGRRGVSGLALAMIGMGLLARSAANRDLGSIAGFGATRGIPVQKTIFIHAEVDQVFDFWRKPENFPRCMHHVRDVTENGENRWRWRVEGPAGSTIEWEAEYSSIVPNKQIMWHTVPGSAADHWGTVRFDADPRGGTRVDIQFEYIPPAGALGHAIAKLFGTDPKSELDDDMLRMKTLLETGRPPHDAAQRESARSDAQAAATEQ